VSASWHFFLCWYTPSWPVRVAGGAGRPWRSRPQWASGWIGAEVTGVVATEFDGDVDRNANNSSNTDSPSNISL
jgi:hypothetical protein